MKISPRLDYLWIITQLDQTNFYSAGWSAEGQCWETKSVISVKVIFKRISLSADVSKGS